MAYLSFALFLLVVSANAKSLYPMKCENSTDNVTDTRYDWCILEYVNRSSVTIRGLRGTDVFLQFKNVTEAILHIKLQSFMIYAKLNASCVLVLDKVNH